MALVCSRLGRFTPPSVSITNALAVRSFGGPDALLQRVVQLEAEAILLTGSLNQVTAGQQDSANPVAIPVDRSQQSRSEVRCHVR